MNGRISPAPMFVGLHVCVLVYIGGMSLCVCVAVVVSKFNPKTTLENTK